MPLREALQIIFKILNNDVFLNAWRHLINDDIVQFKSFGHKLEA